MHVCGPLGDGGQENAGRGGQAERRRVMLGQMIHRDPGLIVGRDQAEPVFIDCLIGHAGPAVEVIEDTEFDHFAIPALGAPAVAVLVLLAGATRAGRVAWNLAPGRRILGVDRRDGLATRRWRAGT